MKGHLLQKSAHLHPAGVISWNSIGISVILVILLSQKGVVLYVRKFAIEVTVWYILDLVVFSVTVGQVASGVAVVSA